MDMINRGSMLMQIENSKTVCVKLHGVDIKIGLHNDGKALTLQRISYPLPIELVKDFHPFFENIYKVAQQRDFEIFTHGLSMLQPWKDPSDANSTFVEFMFQIDSLLETTTEHNTLGNNSFLRKRHSEESIDSMVQIKKQKMPLIQGDAEGFSDPDSSELSKFDPNNLVFKVPKNKPKNGAFAKQWKDHYAKLVQYKQQFGHANVTRVSKGWEHLGSWVANQRRKLRKGKLTRQQYDLLNNVGIEWDRSAYFKAGYHSNPM